MWGISIPADFRLMGAFLLWYLVFGLGKDLLFKSVLRHCAACLENEQNIDKIEPFVLLLCSEGLFTNNILFWIQDTGSGLYLL